MRFQLFQARSFLLAILFGHWLFIVIPNVYQGRIISFTKLAFPSIDTILNHEISFTKLAFPSIDTESPKRKLLVRGIYSKVTLQHQKCRDLNLHYNWHCNNNQDLQNKVQAKFWSAYNVVKTYVPQDKYSYPLSINFGAKTCKLLDLPDYVKIFQILWKLTVQAFQRSNAWSLKGLLQNAWNNCVLSSVNLQTAIDFKTKKILKAEKINFTHNSIILLIKDCFDEKGKIIQQPINNQNLHPQVINDENPNNEGAMTGNRSKEECNRLGGTYRPYLHNMFFIFKQAQLFVRNRALRLRNDPDKQPNACEAGHAFMASHCGYDQFIIESLIPPSYVIGLNPQPIFHGNPPNNLNSFNFWSFDNRRLAMLVYIFKKIQAIELNRLNKDCTFSAFPHLGDSGATCPAVIFTQIHDCKKMQDKNIQFFYEKCVEYKNNIFKEFLRKLTARKATVKYYNPQATPFGQLPNGDGYSIFNSYTNNNVDTSYDAGKCVSLVNFAASEPIIQNKEATRNRNRLMNFCYERPTEEEKELCKQFYNDLLNNGGYICID